MNRKIFLSIITLMLIALIGLMAIQVYWIKNTITVRQGNFTRSVNEAISNVIFRLEKNEMVNEMQERLDILSDEQSRSVVTDSLNARIMKELQRIDNRAGLEKFFNQYFLTRDIFENFILNKPRWLIEERISINLLDSLIYEELNKKSINTNYSFGVFSPEKRKMVLLSKGADPGVLIKEGFAFVLFPSDMTAQKDYLMIYFPNEIRFLVSQMWGLLSISFLLIIIIILSFSYTVFTILRQKKLSEMKNDFINNMTHEFKTPISTISLACQALNDRDINKTPELYDSYVRVINEENARLGSMAEKILQTAILDKGQLKLNRESFDIHEVITDMVKKVGIQVEIKDGRILTDFRADPSEIIGDKMHITNIINNLLDNANKYSPQKPQILVTTTSSKSGVTISIKDNGIGISKANQKKIFEKLYRVTSGDLHDFKGFGLGLSYVKAIVDAHGGNIKLESELRKGTKFDVFLPFNSVKS